MTTKTTKSNGNGKRKPGRPTKYQPQYVEQVYKLCLLGATDAQLSDFFDINKDTLSEWKKSKREFSVSLKEGKLMADSVMAESLYHRAKGYSHSEDKIFLGKDNVPVIVPTIKHYAPDTTALIFWLKNRQPVLWRDKHELDVKGAVVHLHADLGLNDKEDAPVKVNGQQKAIEGVVEVEDGNNTE